MVPQPQASPDNLYHFLFPLPSLPLSLFGFFQSLSATHTHTDNNRNPVMPQAMKLTRQKPVTHQYSVLLMHTNCLRWGLGDKMTESIWKQTLRLLAFAKHKPIYSWSSALVCKKVSFTVLCTATLSIYSGLVAPLYPLCLFSCQIPPHWDIIMTWWPTHSSLILHHMF